MHPIFHLLSDAPKPVAPYSHAVEAGGWLARGGVIEIDMIAVKP
jgi:enamine deaminase RidA (YjgF/YER057c/UK114 family)